MNSIEISSSAPPLTALRAPSSVNRPSSRGIDIIFPGYVKPDEKDEKDEKRYIIRFSKWLLPRIISWGTIAFIVYITLQNLNINVEDIKQASSIVSNGGVTITNTTNLSNLSKITQLWDEHHLLAYHIIGLSIFGLLTNHEAIINDKNSFFCGENNENNENGCMKAVSYYGSQVLGLVTAGAGMVAIYYNSSSAMDYNEWFSSHLYSPHAWFGASTILAWVARHLTGVCMPSYTRLHSSLTRTAYMMGLASCVLGFQSKQTNDLLSLTNVTNSTNSTNILVNMNATNLTNATSLTNVANIVNKNSWVMMQSSVASVLIAASGLATAVWLWL